MNFLILEKGLNSNLKDCIRDNTANKYNAKIIDGSKLNTTDKNKINLYVEKEAYKNLLDGENVLIKGKNLSKKSHTKAQNIKNKINCTTMCNYILINPYLLDLNDRNILMQRKSFYEKLVFPLETEFDDVNLCIKDRILDRDDIRKFLKFYYDNYKLFINDTESFINKCNEIGLLEKVIPELHSIINFNQENTHHKLTLDKHTFKVCENLPKEEFWIWTGLLHDIGKVFPGIKERSEDGNHTYFGHAGASCELSICILKRLGFDIDFIKKVASIISYHMYLPYEGTLSKKKIKKLGEDFYNDLITFRKADMNKK